MFKLGSVGECEIHETSRRCSTALCGKGITPGRGRPHFACCISNDDADAAAGVEGSVGVSRGRKGEREGGGEGPRTVDNDEPPSEGRR